MGKYSQNNEDGIVGQFFSKQEFEVKNLTVLDIGANDGKTLSNSLSCIERGWNATLVEPSNKCFKMLTELHKDNSKIECFKVAIGLSTGLAYFYESGQHAVNHYGENHSLLSSLKQEETTKWSEESFTKTEVTLWDFKTLLQHTKYIKYDLITIDAEGFDYDILTQINLTQVGCQMLIVENNGTEQNKYIEYCEAFGMKLYDKTYQNLIFVK